MKVLLTADQYDMQASRASGIYNYVHNLINGLKGYEDLELTVLRLKKGVTRLAHHEIAPFMPTPSPLSLSLRNLTLPLRPDYLRLLMEHDIIHVTTWGATYTPLLTSTFTASLKLVATIHDIGNVVLPQLYTYKSAERISLILSLKLLGNVADALIAVSESTKSDLIDIIGMPEAKIHVVHEGVDGMFKPMSKVTAKLFIREHYNINNDYMLYVGNAHPRKNLRRLLEASSAARRRGFSWDLILAGVDSRELHALRSRTNTEGVRALGYVPKEHLPYLYSASGIFIFLSLHEGFGLPVLEAMACGVPVVASDASCMPEIVGDAGVLVNPYDAEGIAMALLNLVDNPKLISELSAKGVHRAKCFKWADTIQKTLEVYNRCLT